MQDKEIAGCAFTPTEEAWSGRGAKNAVRKVNIGAIRRRLVFVTFLGSREGVYVHGGVG